MLKGKRVSKHDLIIKSLEARLEDSGDYELIKPNVYYGWGECDLLAVKKYSDGRKALLLFEIKTTNSLKNEHKAREQLHKDLKQFFTKEFDKVFCFYAYGHRKDGYKIRRVRTYGRRF